MTGPVEQASECALRSVADCHVEETPAAGATVTLCPNGPLLLRGDFEITDAHGAPVDARRGTVALCRCGGSAIKPFCDGTHKLNGFTTEEP